MTLPEAREWAREVLEQRSWWMKALFGKGTEDAAPEAQKTCRTPAACSMCTKRCDQRITTG